MQQDWSADTVAVHHSLVQQAGGEAVPLHLAEHLIDRHLLQVEEQGATIGSSPQLTGVRQLVTVSTP